jgi:F-type H+-transporting ATPase subunit delta
MKNPKLASRYAQALYDFSLEANHVEVVYRDILTAHETISSHQELKVILESPIITQEKKQIILREVFQNHFSDITLKFFTLIAKKRRTPQLLMICRQFINIYYQTHHIKEVFITTAQPLSEEMLHYLKTFLEKDSSYTFVFRLSVNPAIIGGLIVRIDDLYFDACIRAKINKLKAEFSQNVYAAGF